MCRKAIRIFALALSLLMLLSMAGCGTAPTGESEAAETAAGTESEAQAAKAEAVELHEVGVSNVDELLAAIAPNTVITLREGTYNLTLAQSYGKATGSSWCYWGNYGLTGDYELNIEGVENLTITGAGAEIVTEPRTSNVLFFKRCPGLVLSGLSIGHTVAADVCEGGVVKLLGCDGALISECSLYGCGTTGVIANESNNLQVICTDIHHCSSTGIDFSNARGLDVDRCRIYDCGKAQLYGAVSAVYLIEAQDVNVCRSEIYGNNMTSLVTGFSSENVSFSDLSVHGNHFSSVFACQYNTRFDNLRFDGNNADFWFTENSDLSITLDGSITDSTGLDALWGAQLSSAGVGVADEELEDIDYGNAKKVHVKSVDAFLAAIASDTIIYIDVPELDLTKAKDYGEGAVEEFWEPVYGDKAYAWSTCYDGYQLNIGNISNFHISGGKIITEPRYANVLSFDSCSEISLENVCLGHSPDMGACSGGVLKLDDVSGMTIESCDLYGCGIMGISATGSERLRVQNTCIHDCSWGACEFSNCDGVVFLSCTIKNCPSPEFSLFNCSDFSWDNTVMSSTGSFDIK